MISFIEFIILTTFIYWITGGFLVAYWLRINDMGLNLRAIMERYGWTKTVGIWVAVSSIIEIIVIALLLDSDFIKGYK